MMMKRLLLTISVSALTALTVFSQYYSKSIFNESITGSFIYQALPIDNEIILFNHKAECDSILYCGGISKFNINLGYSNFFDSHFEEYTVNNLQQKNGYAYISSYNAAPINGKSFWFFKVFDNVGNAKFSTKYEMPTPFNPYTINYGMGLVKNDEIILWGNGFDPSIQNTNDSIKVVWLRIKKDGTLVSGPNYWKPSDTVKFGISTDAATNADGNMVFIRKSRASTGITAFYRAIYEIDENDNVIQRVKFDDERPLTGDYARFCVTKDSGFVSTKGTKEYMPIFIKFDKYGDTLWTCPIPQKYSHHSGYPNMRNIGTEEITRIRQVSNGDIIFCGRNTFIDTMYNHVYQREMLMSDLGGAFFGRIASDGKLKWVHYMVSPKNATDCHYITPNDINEMPNGDLLLGGKIGTSPDSLDYTFQAWIMRVNDKGCFDDDCSHVDKWWFFPEQFPVGAIDLPKYSNDLVLYPNPFRQQVTISPTENATYPLSYQITNMAGQTLSIGIINDISQNIIETGHITSGTYIISVKDKNGQIHYQKGIKI